MNLIKNTIYNYRLLRKSWAYKYDSRFKVLKEAFNWSRHNIRY